MKRLIVGAGLALAILVAGLNQSATRTRESFQSRADASWEGLSSQDQQVITSTGLKGSALDQLVIDYRQTQEDAVGKEGSYYTLVSSDDGVWTATLLRIEEDSPLWDCHKMGNKICGF